jgi:hypothetical protein
MTARTKTWIKAAAVRAIKTFAQTMVASLTVGAAISDISWSTLLSVSAVAALASILTSIAGLPEVDSKAGDANGADAQ